MAKRRMHSLLHNFLDGYCSRYSEYRGYWLFGFLVEPPCRIHIDLLGQVDSVSRDDPVSAAAAIAVARFHEQLSRYGVNGQQMSAASLTIEAHGAARAEAGDPSDRAQLTVRLLAEVTTEKGRRVVCEKELHVAPHDPTLELRSVRPTQSQ